MSRLYGHKFVSNFGASDDGTWLMALSGLQRSDLSRGLTALLSHPDDWPPSVPRFKRMCLGITESHIESRAISLAKAHDSYSFELLPEKEAHRRVRQKLEQATEELMSEYLELASTGMLDNHLNKPISISYKQNYGSGGI